MAIPKLANIEGLRDTVNGRLIDDAIRHALFIEKLKKKHAIRVLKYFQRNIIPDLARKAEKALNVLLAKKGGLWSAKRTVQAIEEILTAYEVAVRYVGDAELKSLKTLAVTEARWNRARLDTTLPSMMTYSANMPSITSLKSFIESKPFDKWTMGKWWDNLSKGSRSRITTAVRIGVVEGETIPQIVSRMRKIAKTTARQAAVLARTGVAHITSEARYATYRENSDIIGHWQFVATLDSRTSDICMGYDGKIFKLGEGPRPPLHHQCRSIDVCIVKSFKELGLDKYGLKDLPPAQRAALGGPVKGTIDYEAWLKTQDLRTKQLALGKNWGEKFHRGEASLEDYLNRTKPGLRKAG